jgi:hypothetical protein
MSLINIFTDNISGLVLADKLDSKFKLKVYIPKDCRFNGFLKIKNDLTFSGSRLFELSYLKKSSSKPLLKDFNYEYKSHLNYMDYILDYYDSLNLNQNLKNAPEPLLQFENILLEDFMYGSSLNSINKINNKYLKKIENNLKKIQQNKKITNYGDYESLIQKDESFSQAVIESNGNEMFQHFYKPLKDKLAGDYEIISKYHRVVWLPILWTKTLEDVLFENKKQDSQKFHQFTTESGIPNIILDKIEKKDNIKISYFDKKSIRFEDNKIIIENNVIEDSENNYFGININQHFKKQDELENVNLHYSWVSIDRSHLLKEFSQISFLDPNLPYRISYREFSSNIVFCVEHGVVQKSIDLIFKKLIELNIFSDLVFSKLTVINELSIKNMNIPTSINYVSFMKTKDAIKDMIPKTNLLSPYCFYQSNALNDQVTLGLVEASKKNG